MKAARLAMAAGAFLFIAMATSASAAVRPVDIVGFKFEPQSVTITAGDTVTWTNRDAAAHSARVNGVGTTAVLTQGQSGSLPFTNAGPFPYDCGIHGAAMMGTVIVRAAATPPPTPRPTVARTLAPTVAPTVVSTPVPTVTVAPSASPTPTPSVAPTTAAPSVTSPPSVAVAVPTEQAPAPAASDGVSSTALLVGGALLVLLAVGAFALTRIKR